MKKKILSIALALCMVLTMMPIATGVAWADPATSVTVGGVQMVNGSTTTYYKNGDTASTGLRGTSTDYNAMYEPGTGSEPGTLTLNGLNLTRSTRQNLINANVDIAIKLEGENTLVNNSNSGGCAIYVDGSLKISGSGELHAYNGNNAATTIYASGSIEIEGAEVTAIKAGGDAQAIHAERGAIVITDSATVLATNNGTRPMSYALLADNSQNGNNINVSNGATLIATSGTQAVKGNISLSGDLVVRAGTDSPGIKLTIATNPFERTEKYVMIGPPAGLSSIAVTTPPTKTTYIAGDNFDPTGMVVTATYNDDSTAVVNGYTVTDGNDLTAGKTSVTISYTKGVVTKTITQNITVNAAPKVLSSIAVTTPPTKTTYIAGDNFDTTGMVVTATYNDGSTAAVNGYTVTDGNNLTAGKTSVTISYTEGVVTKTITQNITVNAAPKVLSSIAVTTPPTKTTYIAGDNFDPTGMVVTATYNDDSTAVVNGYTVTDGNDLTAGKTSVTISYTEGVVTKTITQNITVKAPSGGGSYVPTTEKPTIIADEGAETTLSILGTKLTIKVTDGYELSDVILNGTSKGKVTELTGLKTGDKVEVKTEKKQEEPKEPTKEEIIAALDSSKLVARSKLITLKNGKKAVRVTWYDKNGKEVDFDGIEIYRSTQRYKGYGLKPFYATKDGKTEGYYVNTKDLKEGTTYYYKVRGYIKIDGQKYYTDYSLKAIRTVK